MDGEGRFAAVLLALALAACGGESTTGIGDPPVLRIAMDGTWGVASITRIGSGDLPTPPGGIADPFRPLHLHMELRVQDGLLRARDGTPLFEVFDPLVANSRWTNHADGWNLFFDFANGGTGSGGCTRYDEIMAFFVPRDEDHMVGNVTILSSGDCATPPRLPPEATGQFSVVLERAAQPQVGR